MVSGRARLQSLRKNSVSYQGMPLGIPQVAEIGSGFSRCWQRNNSIHAGFGKGTASGCGKTLVLDFALKGRGFSRAVSVAKSMAALAAEGPAVYFFLTCGSFGSIAPDGGVITPSAKERESSPFQSRPVPAWGGTEACFAGAEFAPGVSGSGTVSAHSPWSSKSQARPGCDCLQWVQNSVLMAS
jgi:hypothetical protein